MSETTDLGEQIVANAVRVLMVELNEHGGVSSDSTIDNCVRHVLQALAAARAQVEALQSDLAAVRTVEEWVREFGAGSGRAIRYDSEFEARDSDGEFIEGAQSLVALGRALAAQEGDHEAR